MPARRAGALRAKILGRLAGPSRRASGVSFKAALVSVDADNNEACTGKSGTYKHANIELGPLSLKRKSGSFRTGRFFAPAACNVNFQVELSKQISRE
jgi:hypothetical protein